MRALGSAAVRLVWASKGGGPHLERGHNLWRDGGPEDTGVRVRGSIHWSIQQVRRRALKLVMEQLYCGD